MPSPRSTVRYTVHGVTLAGLLGGGMALSSLSPLAPPSVAATLSVDGSARSVHSSGPDVRDLLRDAGVTVGPHDVVAPTLDSPVHNGSHVVVLHGRRLTLTVGDTTRTVWVTEPTVGAAIDAIGLRTDGAFVSASRSGRIPLTGAVVVVREPQRVTLRLGTWTGHAVTTAATVGQFLAENHVRLGPLDRLTVPRSAYPVARMRIGVDRVSRAVTRDITSLPAPVERVADGHLVRGHSAVRSAGRAGRRVQWYAEKHVNGRLVSRHLTKVTTVEPAPRVVLYGTAAPVVHHYATVSGGHNWAAVAQCESSGNPSIVSGPYYGLYQFTIGTWRSVGGSGLPSQASAAEQTYRAELLYQRDGRAPWPVCGRYL